MSIRIASGALWKNYLEQTSQVNAEGNKITTNSETNGRYHTDWLNMIFPRVKLARNLLTEDGVIFISIDDKEQANLRKVCDELFGERNLITQIAHKARASVSNDKIISQNHNIILLYAKNIDVIFSKRNTIGLDPVLKGFSNPDNDPRGDWKGTPADGPGGAKKGNPYYDFMGVKGYFRYSKEKMQQLYEDNLIVRTKNGLQRKYFLKDAKNSRKTDTSWWDDGGYTSNATKQLINLMGGKTFDTPKPVELIEKMLRLFTRDDKDSIILDFFSGSAATAEAVMKFNSEDAGHRRYILVQLPELIEKKTDAFIAGFRTIPEIAEERIRRAGERIIETKPVSVENLDIGFKVFELSKSNIKKWNVTPESTDISSQIALSESNFVEQSEPIDIVYEIMIKQGLDLAYPISEAVVGKANIYDVAFGSMFVVLGEEIASGIANFIIKQICNDEVENSVVVFQDEKFINDSEKLNTIEQLNARGIHYDDILSI